ncbi:hypothetical protein [Allofranklinella schreckenbergeri]|nr:hypothetical protein [Allofranklinella schreckenbergeri]
MFFTPIKPKQVFHFYFDLKNKAAFKAALFLLLWLAFRQVDG